MARKTFERPKTPTEQIDYMVSWKRALKGDTIVSSAWTRDTADTSGIVVERTSFTPVSAIIWFTGGITGRKALFTNTITTAGGRVIQSPIAVNIKG